ncbi:MAG: sugar transferase [Pseudomonadota bacterium]
MSLHDKELSRVVISEPSAPGAGYVAHREGFYKKVGKRAFDIAIVLLLAPIAIVIIAVLALLLVLEGGRPFYVQQRLGKSDVPFPMLKLRTMVPDSDARLAAYLAEHPAERLEWDRHQKLKCDPRVTRFGKLLRKTSLDELPQLLNVLLGHMSLVGPRPMMVNQRQLYPGSAYFLLKPGITGYWQVSERNECEFRDRAIYDNKYYEEMSFAADMNVLLSTARVVVKGAGY